MSAQYLEAAEDYHWGNVGGQGPEHCFVNASTCQKDMWHNELPGYDVVDEIFCEIHPSSNLVAMFPCWYNSQASVCGRGVPDSANYYTSRAIALIEGRDKSKPFYLHQTYQSVHVLPAPPPFTIRPEKSSAGFAC